IEVDIAAKIVQKLDQVQTVDSFQGDEKDIIILSTMRCNNKGSLGFVDCDQRTNVAVTRANFNANEDNYLAETMQTSCSGSSGRNNRKHDTTSPGVPYEEEVESDDAQSI
ncbi:hypothetical protein EJB05_05466, partial [Eragrostis curvula]